MASCGRQGLKVNSSKCAVTAGLYQIWKYEKSAKWGKDPRVCNKLQGKIRLLGEIVPAISAGTSYTYLGLPLNMTLDWTDAFNMVKSKMDTRMAQIFNMCRLPKGCMMRMVEELVKTIPIYAFAVTPFTHTQLHELERLAARALRMAANLPGYHPIWNLSEDQEHGGLGTGSLYSHMIQTAARCFTEAINDNGRLGVSFRALLAVQIRTLQGHPCIEARTGWDKQARFAMGIRQLTLFQ